MSKWLTWQPGFVGSVGPSQGGNSIIHSDSDMDRGISYVPTPSIIENYPRDLPSKPTEPPPPDSAYTELVGQAMQRIVGICPPGALKWAREAHPALAERIDVEIFSRLNDLWGNHAPLSEFQGALDDLVQAHCQIGNAFAAETQPSASTAAPEGTDRAD
jgi:hypothetical protein